MSLRKAINEKCKDCIYDELASGTWRKQVSECNSKDCSLFNYRPLDKANSDAVKQANLANLTVKQIEERKRKRELLKKRFARK